MAAPGIVKRELLVRAIYYAPRGRTRLYGLAAELSQRYLHPTDRLIAIIGAEGSGKSTLIRGLFPGLELTNDDDGINKPTSPAFDFDPDAQFSGHTFHMDMRYEMAFHQVHTIVEAIKSVLVAQRRIVIEHFDLIYRHLGLNAQLIFGIGEYVRVYRPTVFGPSPEEVRKVAFDNLKYRLMAHSAEDMVGKVLLEDYKFRPDRLHSELHHGFAIGFDSPPDIDLDAVEERVNKMIRDDIILRPGEGDHILIGGEPFYCTGKRCHVKSAGKIEHFRILKDYKYDRMTHRYLLVGLVGEETVPIELVDELPPVQEELSSEESESGQWVEIGSFRGKV